MPLTITTVTVALIVVGFILFFAMIWAGVSFLLAAVSGWRQLAALYGKVDPTRRGSCKSVWYARIGFVRYKSVLRLEAFPEGLCFKLFILFRVGAPAFIIPWNDLLVPQLKHDSFFTMYSFQAGKAPGVSIRLSQAAAQWVVEQKEQFLK